MNEHKQVIIFPRGQLSAHDRKSLTEAGIIVCTAPDPKAVVQLVASAGQIAADDMLMSALKGVLTGSYTSADAMVKELHRRLLANEVARSVATDPKQSPDPQATTKE